MTTPPTAPESLPPGGPAWAAVVAAAVGCFAFGAAVDLAEAVPRVSRALNLYNPTGDLSGKSAAAVLVWLLAWLLLHARWSRRDPRSPARAAAVTVALFLLAVLAVFPPFFGLLTHR